MFEAFAITAVLTTPAIGTVGYLAVQLGKELHELEQEKAVQKLQETYNSVLGEEVPEHFTDLLGKLK